MVGMYHKDIDGSEFIWDPVEKKEITVKSEQGNPAPGPWTKNPITEEWDVPVDVGQKQCFASLKNAGIGAQPLNASGEAPEVKEVLENAPYPQNVAWCDFSKIPDSELSGHRYEFEDKNSGKKTTYTWEDGIDPKKFSAQIARESNTFCGDVRIRKLEPGTVLVRVFGQGQSVKASCWAKLDDDSSSVTCTQDLYKKLAVKAEWNGDGNLGILVVPEGTDIYVAEGKIASQAEKYAAEVKRNGKNTQQQFTFLYEGGGTQVNILTPNLPRQEQVEGPVTEKGNKPLAYETFAGIYPDVFEKCMFCFRNDNIIAPKQSI